MGVRDEEEQEEDGFIGRSALRMHLGRFGPGVLRIESTDPPA